jgi:hypothetical protein
MKHLKTFENIELKRYIICDDIRVDGTSIYQILGDRNRDITLKIIARYNNGVDVGYIRDMIYYGNKYENLNIYYQTDDLDDALDKLKMVDISKKYNI